MYIFLNFYSADQSQIKNNFDNSQSEFAYTQI